MIAELFQGLDVDIVFSTSGMTGDSIHDEETQQGTQGTPKSLTPCPFPGNCPTGTACVQGKCHPYLDPAIASNNTSDEVNKQIQNRQRLAKCVDSCLEELIMEEGFQYGSIPIMVEPPMSVLFPHQGCVLVFQRQRRTEAWTDRPSLETRLLHRYRRVQKVDYYHYSGSEQHHLWTAFCHDPCQTDQDCRGDWTCHADIRRPEEQDKDIPKVCQPPEPTNKPEEREIVYVSGADVQYFEALENYAASLYYWAPTRKLAVYNLGMEEYQIDRVQTWPNVIAVHWKDGLPSQFPPHVHENLRNYAWKPLAIQDSLQKYHAILWIDAGATLVAPVEPLEEALMKEGLFLVKGQDDDMKARSHEGMFQWYGYDKDAFKAGPSYAGGIQGHLLPSPYVDTIVNPNVKCALDPLCIHPEGADLGNHRFDQSSLSILAYQPHVRARQHTEYLAGGRDQLADDLSESSAPFIIWTARGLCSHYSKHNGFDSNEDEDEEFSSGSAER